MENFKIQTGPEQKQLSIELIKGEPDDGKQFNIYGDVNEEWIDDPQEKDVPEGTLIGTITVRSEKDFDFEGSGNISGADLLSIAAQITRHPSFNS